MKKIITLFAVWMMAVMAFAQNYGILITNTSELVSATYDGYFLENESTPYEQYLAHVNLSVGDRCKLYDLDNQTAWTVPLDEYSTSDIYLDQTNNEYVCSVGGCFDFYIKLRYNEDKLYIGAGSGCTNGTTPQGNDPVGEDISQEEEERRICLSHKKLMVTELNNSTPMLLDSAGQQVTMPVDGYPMENAIQYDLTSLGRGRYTLIVDSDTLLFDFGTEVTTSYTKEGEDCPTYNSVINATIKQGQTYLFICDKKTEPGTYSTILSNMTQCDSMVVLYLSFEEDEIPCEPDTLIIDAMTCEGEAFTWRGEEFTDPGTYELTVQQHGGCDSVFIINLSVNPTYHIEEIVSVREDRLPYIWNEQEIMQSGEYFAELSTRAGCDSIITLRLTVTQLPIYSVTAIADHGFVNGTGTYPEGTEIYLEAQADEGFAFQMWSDGTTENPKQFILTRDTTLRALFYMPEVEQEVVVDSIETNSVTITWDTVAGAVLYELRIYKNGMLVVTYQVDRDNNIINQIFAVPDRLIARRDSTGGSSETLQVSVGGLEPGQDYTYSLDAMDDDRSYVGAQSGTFTTEEEPVEGLDALFDDRRNTPRKVISNGRLYIEMPDGTRYDATGQELIRN